MFDRPDTGPMRLVRAVPSTGHSTVHDRQKRDAENGTDLATTTTAMPPLQTDATGRVRDDPTALRVEMRRQMPSPALQTYAV